MSFPLQEVLQRKAREIVGHTTPKPTNLSLRGIPGSSGRLPNRSYVHIYIYRVVMFSILKLRLYFPITGCVLYNG